LRSGLAKIFVSFLFSASIVPFSICNVC
jgi:hypothetical protein